MRATDSSAHAQRHQRRHGGRVGVSAGMSTNRDGEGAGGGDDDMATDDGNVVAKSATAKRQPSVPSGGDSR